jgi:prolyl oligopeptidase
MSIIRLLIAKLTVCSLLLAFITVTQAQMMPPKARVDSVMDEYFGVKIADQYRWMEDLKAKETQDWMKAQADYADAYLDKLPMRDDILKRLTEVSSASV